MTIIRRRGDGGMLPSFRSNLSEIFDIDRFFNQPLLETPFLESRLYNKVPAANILELDDEFVVEIAAPGMTKKDFHIDIDNNMLEIKVEKEESTKEEKSRYTRKEYDYTAFYRAFDLPETVHADKIKAEYKEGILKVHLPKVPAAKRKPVKEIAVS